MLEYVLNTKTVSPQIETHIIPSFRLRTTHWHLAIQCGCSTMIQSLAVKMIFTKRKHITETHMFINYFHVLSLTTKLRFGIFFKVKEHIKLKSVKFLLKVKEHIKFKSVKFLLKVKEHIKFKSVKFLLKFKEHIKFKSVKFFFIS